jgi:hypothetical protein
MLALIALPILLLHTAAAAMSVDLPLRKIAPVQDYRLRGTMDSFNFSIPIPYRWTVRNATLHFKYVNSSSLIPENSRLVFLVNDQPLAQVRLNPATPEGEVTVPIPGSLFKPGYVPCSFWVSQHYTMEHCEDPFAPELWTTILLSEAGIVFDIEPVAFPQRVSAITDFLFDARNIFDTRVHIAIPQLTPAYLEAASLAAAGISLRYGYRIPEISLSDGLRPDMDNVLIADGQDLPRLTGQAAPAAAGARIALQGLPDNRPAAGAAQPAPAQPPVHALVVISGKDEAELMTASRAFASLSYPLPNSPSTQVSALKLPEIHDHMVAGGILAHHSYTFESLGVHTTEFRSIAPPHLHLDLRMPSDLYLSPNKFASVILHMAYDAGMRSDSVLNVLLNGKFISGVRLDNPRGDLFRAYKLDIPLSSFKSGMNRLSFEAVLTPLHTDKCKLIQTNNLRLSIFEDSKFILPEVPYWIKMPQLEAFFQDGFPVGQWADLREAAVLLTEKTFPTANAALNLVALCAQKIGFPPFALKWLFDAEPEKTHKDLFVLGSLRTLPTALSARAPLAGIDPMRLSFPQIDRPQSGRTSEPVQFWQTVAPTRPENPQNMSDVRAKSPVSSELTGSLGNGRAVLMQLQHPADAAHSIIILTADSAADLLAGSRALWNPAVQSGCRGDLALVNLVKVDYDVIAHVVGPSYFLGNPGRFPVVQNFINSHPVLSLGILLALLLIMCLLILRMLKNRRQRRLAPSHE